MILHQNQVTATKETNTCTKHIPPPPVFRSMSAARDYGTHLSLTVSTRLGAGGSLCWAEVLPSGCELFQVLGNVVALHCVSSIWEYECMGGIVYTWWNRTSATGLSTLKLSFGIGTQFRNASGRLGGAGVLGHP